MIDKRIALHFSFVLSEENFIDPQLDFRLTSVLELVLDVLVDNKHSKIPHWRAVELSPPALGGPVTHHSDTPFED